MRSSLFIILALFALRSIADDDPWFGVPPDLRDVSSSRYVSIVFAGENLRSPISMFGHTFLVFHNSETPEPGALTIEYLAKAPEGVVQTLAGAFGTLDGKFRVTRFAYKQKEYDLEDRDLWVFHLRENKLHRPEIASRLKAALENPKRYNFFGSNCSFHILELLVGNTKGFGSMSLYTIPITTIQDLKRKGWVDSARFIPSTLSLVHHHTVALTNIQRASIDRALKGYTEEMGDFSNALAVSVNYRLPRESKAPIRNHLLNLKRQHPFRAGASPDTTSSTDRRIGYLQLGVHPPKQLFTLTMAPAFQDFFNQLGGPLDFSTLSLLKVQLATDTQAIYLSELNIFRMESLISPRFLSSEFVRFLDLTYHNWSLYLNGINDVALRFGIGWSREFFRGAQFALIPIVGARVYFPSSAKFGGVLGVRSHVQVKLTSRMRTRLIYQFEPFSPIGFKHLLQWDIVPFETQRWGLFGSLVFADTAAGSGRVLAGFTVFL